MQHPERPPRVSWRSLSARDRRAILAAFIVLGPIFVIRIAVVPALHAMEDARARLERERDFLQREDALLDTARTFAAAFRATGNELVRLAPTLLPGETPEAARAALAQRIRELVERRPVLLRRLEAAPTDSVGEGVVAVSLEVEGESDLEGFLKIVAGLEAGPTLLRLDDLIVERGAGAGRPDTAVRPGSNATAPVSNGAATESSLWVAAEVIRFSFVVTGYFFAAPAGAGVGSGLSSSSGPSRRTRPSRAAVEARTGLETDEPFNAVRAYERERRQGRGSRAAVAGRSGVAPSPGAAP